MLGSLLPAGWRLSVAWPARWKGGPRVSWQSLAQALPSQTGGETGQSFPTAGEALTVSRESFPTSSSTRLAFGKGEGMTAALDDPRRST